MDRYCYNDKVGDEQYHRGMMFSKRGKFERINLFVYKQDQIKSLLLQPNGTHPSLLLPEFVHIKDNDEVVVVYKEFEEFSKWILENKKEPFQNPGTPLHEWWQENTGSLLGGTQYLHENDKFHGGLGNIANYVILEGKIKLINVGLEGDSTLSLSQRMLTDRVHLKNFLQDNVTPNKGSRDWIDFLDHFTLDSFEELHKHPVKLLTMKRHAYFRQMLHCRRMMSKDVLPKQKHSEQDNFHFELRQLAYNDYRQFLDGYLKSMFRNGKDSDRTGQGLFNFLEKTIDHYKDNPELDTNGNPKGINVYKLEAKISRTFPYFISDVHRILVTHFPKNNVTRKRLGPIG